MLNENAKKWVEALRSGDYKQGTGYLRYPTPEGDRFCCLGVACELAIEEGIIDKPSLAEGHTTDRYRYEGTMFVLPTKVREWLGIRSEDGGYNCYDAPYEGDSLADLNDEGKTFEEIAATIEHQPEDLFE